MNTDIRLSTGFWQHPKTRKTVKRLGLEGVRSLQILWLWAAQNRPDGNLTGMDWEDIELAADWQGEERAFFDHSLGIWIDEAPAGYILHDWAEHNPWQAEADARREQARKNAKSGWEKRKKAPAHDSGIADSMPPQCDGNAAALRPHEFGNAPSPIPSPKKKTPPLPPHGGCVSVEGVFSPPSRLPDPEAPAMVLPCEMGMAFQQFLDAYPAGHREPAGEAANVWRSLARQKKLPGLPRLMDGITAWEKSEQWQSEGGKFIPKAANFLRNAMWMSTPARASPSDDGGALRRLAALGKSTQVIELGG